MASVIPTNFDVCPRGGFFDGNDNFGGMPFRFLMALLVASPLMYTIGSAGWWCVNEYRRRRLLSVDPASYRSMDHSNSSQPIPPSQSQDNTNSTNSINNTTNNSNNNNNDVEEPTSPKTSSSIAPASCSPASLSISAQSSEVVNPFLRARAAHTAYITQLRSMLSSMSFKYRALMFCRIASRPINLYKFAVIISCIHLILNIFGLLYGIIAKERCCEGGTGALYAILALRVCISYLCIRVVSWQTSSDTNVIPLSDKACNIGFLIHELWLSIAWILAQPGDCATNAPVMYNVGMVNILSLLIQMISLLILAIIIKNSDGLATVICRTLLKLSLSGWSYGGALDLPDAATGVEIEIACLPCLPYGPNVHKMLAPLKEAAEKDSTVKIDSQDMAALSACPSTILNVDANIPAVGSNAEDRSKCEAGLSCAICLNGYELNEMIRPLPCGHHFHKNCTDTWLRVKSTCPLCVRSVLLL